MDVGAKLTFTVQLPWAGRLVPQFWDALNWPLTLTLLTPSAVLPVLVTVTACGLDVTPTARLPNDSEPTDREPEATSPVPPSAMDWAPAPVETLSPPVTAPSEVGANTTLYVQLAPAASELPQVVDSTEKGPLVAAGPMDEGALPELVNVMLCAAEVDPTIWPLKGTTPGAAETTACRPVPERLRVRGLFDASLATASIPLRMPAAEGENATETVQVAPGASFPQLLVAVKSGVPAVTLALETLAVVPPAFVTDKTSGKLVAPTGTAGNAPVPLTLSCAGVGVAVPLPLPPDALPSETVSPRTGTRTVKGPLA